MTDAANRVEGMGSATRLALGLLACVGCLGLLLVASPARSQAAASKPLSLAVSHPKLGSGASVNFWLSRAGDQTNGAGAGLYHHYVTWRTIAPANPTASFDPTDPDDPQYDFSRLDQVVRAVAANGMESMMSVYSAPDFAEGAGRPASAFPGTWKPSPSAYADFATALATRYSGSHVPPGDSTALPRVGKFEAWNESNLATFLTPQMKGKKLVGADHYRKLVNAFYSAVHAVQPDAKVAAGATAPFGAYYGAKAKKYIPPLRFLRRLLCLREAGRGKLKRACGAKVSLDALSHHPISNQRGKFTNPAKKPSNPDDLSASNFGKLRTLLRSAERLGRVVSSGTGARELWATEIWEFSNPPDPKCGVSLAKQARNIQQSMYLIASQGASSIHYYTIGDIEPEQLCFWTGSGLYKSNGVPKPALTGFRFPFVTVRNSKGVNAWGRAPVSGTVVIERLKGGWREVASVPVTAGNTFNALLGKLRGPGRYRASVGGQTSLTWSQSSGRW